MKPVLVGRVFLRDDVLDGRSPEPDHGLNHIQRVVAKELAADRLTHQLAVIYRKLVVEPLPTRRPDHGPITIRWLDLSLLDERSEEWMQNPDVGRYVVSADPYILAEVTQVDGAAEFIVNWVRERRAERQRWELCQRRGRPDVRRTLSQVVPYLGARGS